MGFGVSGVMEEAETGEGADAAESEIPTARTCQRCCAQKPPIRIIAKFNMTDRRFLTRSRSMCWQRQARHLSRCADLQQKCPRREVPVRSSLRVAQNFARRLGRQRIERRATGRDESVDEMLCRQFKDRRSRGSRREIGNAIGGLRAQILHETLSGHISYRVFKSLILGGPPSRKQSPPVRARH